MGDVASPDGKSHLLGVLLSESGLDVAALGGAGREVEEEVGKVGANERPTLAGCVVDGVVCTQGGIPYLYLEHIWVSGGIWHPK